MTGQGPTKPQWKRTRIHLKPGWTAAHLQPGGKSTTPSQGGKSSTPHQSSKLASTSEGGIPAASGGPVNPPPGRGGAGDST